jgi:uncharacterized protein (DUF1697 family)
VTSYVALLRAVNVGGTGKLPMASLVAICEAAGLRDTRTYIASGNAVFRSDLPEEEVRAALGPRLSTYAGKPVDLVVRSGEEMTAVLAANPFADAPGGRVLALFTDAALPGDPLEGATGHRDEQVVAGPRVLFVHYPGGMAGSRLRLRAERSGTVRNMNTVARLAAMAAA